MMIRALPKPSPLDAAVEFLSHGRENSSRPDPLWTASAPESSLSRQPQSRALLRYASILLQALALRHIVRGFSACPFEIQPIYPSCPSMSLC